MKRYAVLLAATLHVFLPEHNAKAAITYHNGPLLQNPAIEIVLWTAKAGDATQLRQFYQTQTQAFFDKFLSEYNVPGYTIHTLDASVRAWTITPVHSGTTLVLERERSMDDTPSQDQQPVARHLQAHHFLL